MTVLAFVALFTGTVLVFSVLSLSVAKRSQQFALLGVLGLTATERMRLVLLESAAFADRVRHAKTLGIVLPGEPTIDYAQMTANKDQVVKRMWTGLKSLVDKNKVTWVAGRGRLDGPQKVRVLQPADDGTPGKGGERVLQATDVVLATGSRVKSLPGLTPDGKKIVTSDDVLKMTSLPKDIVIVGAGAVGVEFASMFADIGVPVTLIEYAPQSMGRGDPSLHIHTMYRDPTNDYGRKRTSK